MTRDGLTKALENVSRKAGYKDDSDDSVLVLVLVVFLVCLIWASWLYPFEGVIVP